MEFVDHEAKYLGSKLLKWWYIYK